MQGTTLVSHLTYYCRPTTASRILAEGPHRGGDRDSRPHFADCENRSLEQRGRVGGGTRTGSRAFGTLAPLCRSARRSRIPARAAPFANARARCVVGDWYRSGQRTLQASKRRSAAGAATRRLTLLRKSWREIQPTNKLRDLAETCLHLRTPDAVQLAAALVWCNQKAFRSSNHNAC
jgi:hypothetical protein